MTGAEFMALDPRGLSDVTLAPGNDYDGAWVLLRVANRDGSTTTVYLSAAEADELGQDLENAALTARGELFK